MAGRILIVDDESDIREIATLSMESIGGWQVRAVSSGVDAVRVIEQEGDAFDAVLLDVMMPELDGPSTLAALRATERGAGMPVIFLTAKVQPADKRFLEEAGATGILAKPFDPMRLPEEVARILEHHR